jgi:nucleotidyltransferase/DNA polymerase involved in DNA repair
MGEFSPKVEYYSVDEFFFEAIPLPGKDLQQTAEAIRDRLLQEIGVPATVGIARTRTLAKLISDSAKPFGARAVLGSDDTAALLASQPVTEISGIAGRRERRLLPWGITTCLDLAQADRGLIRELLTASGEALWWELRGDSVLPLLPERPMHEVLSRGGSFGDPVTDPIILWAWLARNLERLIEELEFHQLATGRLTVWIGYRNGQEGSGTVRLAGPSQRFDVLLDAARPCVRRAWRPRIPASRMQVLASDLTDSRRAQLGLFEQPSGRATAIARVKRTINERHGRFVLRSGATLPLYDVYQDAANGYDICDIRGKMCF